MKWTQVPAGDINAANQRLWVAVGDNAEEVATRINTDPTFVAIIAQIMVKGRYESSTSQIQARAIMGKNFFGIEEAIKHFKVNPTKRQFAALAEVPFSEEVLREYKDTHVLVAVFSLSILSIRDIVKKSSGQDLFFSQDWYEKESFAKSEGEISWQLVRKEPVANSFSKTWDEQRILLSGAEEIPAARIMVYTIIGHFLATGERLFKDTYVRVFSFDADWRSVIIGYFDANGLSVSSYGSDARDGDIGLSAARRKGLLII